MKCNHMKVALKRTASLFLSFLSEKPAVEAKALARKLRKDWAAEPKIWELSLSLEPAGRYPSPPLPVKSVKILNDQRAILAGVGKSVLLFPFSSLQQGQSAKKTVETSVQVVSQPRRQLRHP